MPVTAADFVFTHEAIRRALPPDSQRPRTSRPQRPRASSAKTLRVVLRRAYADWRVLFCDVLPRHALAGEDLTRVWRDGIDESRGRARRSGAAPSSSRAWIAAEQLTLVRNPRYWGPHTAYLDRLVIRFCRPAAPITRRGARDASGRGDVDMACTRDTERSSPEFAGHAGMTRRPPPHHGMEHLVFRLGPGGHPGAPEQARPPGARLRHRPGRRSRGESSGSSTRPTGRCDSAVFVEHRALLPPELERLPLPARSRAPPARAGRLPAGADGIYVVRRASGSRLRFVDDRRRAVRERTLELHPAPASAGR